MTLEERLEKYLMVSPKVDETAYISKNAVLMGSVRVGKYASVFPNCTLRADLNTIEIGDYSNIQDGTQVHLADDFGVKIGDYTTVGHGAILHGCEIGSGCLIGMGATVLDGAVVGDECIIGAGALVTKNSKIPAGSMVLGSPGKVVKELDEKTRKGLLYWAEKYSQIAAKNKEYEAKDFKTETV